MPRLFFTLTKFAFAIENQTIWTVISLNKSAMQNGTKCFSRFQILKLYKFGQCLVSDGPKWPTKHGDKNILETLLSQSLNKFLFKVQIVILRRPQKFGPSSSTLFWRYLVTSNISGRWAQIVWPSQSIWTLTGILCLKALLILWISRFFLI